MIVFGAGGGNVITPGISGSGATLFGMLKNLSTFEIVCGQTAEWSSGGSGYTRGGDGGTTSTWPGNGGGGSSAILVNSIPVIIAGDGGGSGAGLGNGGAAGQPGQTWRGARGGEAGNAVDGLGGCNLTVSDYCGYNASSGNGGNGGGSAISISGGGGGGAGWRGGGGGQGSDTPNVGGGGGGGSSYVNSIYVSYGWSRGTIYGAVWDEYQIGVGNPGQNGGIVVIFIPNQVCGNGRQDLGEMCDGSIGCNASCQCSSPMWTFSSGKCVLSNQTSQSTSGSNTTASMTTGLGSITSGVGTVTSGVGSVTSGLGSSSSSVTTASDSITTQPSTSQTLTSGMYGDGTISSDLESPNPSGIGSKNRSIAIIAGAASGGVLLFGILIFAIFIGRRKRKSKEGSIYLFI